MRPLLTLLCVAALAAPAASWAADNARPGANNSYRVAEEAMDAGLYGVAAAEYMARARRGDARAQFEIGRIFAEKIEVDWNGRPSNPFEGMRWMTRAAAQGYLPAMEQLAIMYAQGVGVEKDPERVEFWRSAIDRRLHPPGPPVYDPNAGKIEVIDRDNVVMRFSGAADLDKMRDELRIVLTKRTQTDREKDQIPPELFVGPPSPTPMPGG